MNLLLILGVVSLANPANDPAPAHGPPSTLTDSAWHDIRASREQVVKRYLETTSAGYEWFAHALHGEAAGTPFLLLRLLPELAPDIWGPPEERLARFGFIEDPKDPQRPLPLGLGWVLDPVHGDKKDAREYHSASLTCASCHVGRVRVGPEKDLVLIGAPNTQIDVRRFRRAVELTTDRLLVGPALSKTSARMADLIKAKPDGYFFGGRYGISTADEDRERERFRDPAYTARVLSAFARRVLGGRAAVQKQLMTSYSKANAPPLDGGSPGQSDGSGDLIPKFLLLRELKAAGDGDPVPRFLKAYYPEMPYRNATVTDNLSVWRQADRPFGQLDGSIKAPIIRNIAAQTAVVGSPVDVNVKNADIAVRFTTFLPSPPYPFDVDMVRARRGEALYQQHCTTCHRVANGTVYGPGQIDTDSNRARVLSEKGKELLVSNFKAAIPKNYEATTAEGVTYKPGELTDDEIINDRTRPDRQGYVAGPLDGIWARAPYLHNGSVPTMRHLLAPHNPESLRPRAFFRGSVRYDTVNLGFAWDLHGAAALRVHAPSGVIFDTGWDSASNLGHDRDVLVDGQLRRLDWSGPEYRTDLEDLLEYIKTL